MEKIVNFGKIIEKLQNKGKITKMVVAGADNESTLECCRKVKDLKIADSILVGDKKNIIKMSTKLNINISDFKIIDIQDQDEIARYSSKLVHDKKVDIFFKGSLESKPMMKAILDKEIGFKNDKNVCGIALFEINQKEKTRLFIMSDPAIRPYPTLEEKKSIINHTVKLAHMIGKENPKVAILAALNVVDPEIKETVEADKLTKMNENGEIKGCIVEGPISLDLALDPESCNLSKNNNRKIQGDADILIFNDIHSSNIVYKSFIHLLKWKSGMVMAGTKAPCILNSRADSFDVKFNSIILSSYYHDYLSNKNDI